MNKLYTVRMLDGTLIMIAPIVTIALLYNLSIRETRRRISYANRHNDNFEMPSAPNGALRITPYLSGDMYGDIGQ